MTIDHFRDEVAFELKRADAYVAAWSAKLAANPIAFFERLESFAEGVILRQFWRELSACAEMLPDAALARLDTLTEAYRGEIWWNYHGHNSTSAYHNAFAEARRAKIAAFFRPDEHSRIDKLRALLLQDPDDADA